MAGKLTQNINIFNLKEKKRHSLHIFIVEREGGLFKVIQHFFTTFTLTVTVKIQASKKIRAIHNYTLHKLQQLSKISLRVCHF